MKIFRFEHKQSEVSFICAETTERAKSLFDEWFENDNIVSSESLSDDFVLETDCPKKTAMKVCEKYSGFWIEEIGEDDDNEYYGELMVSLIGTAKDWCLLGKGMICTTTFGYR